MMQNNQVKLRQTVLSDLEILFQIQQDKQSNYLAAFVAKDHSNKDAYIAKFTRFLLEPTINMRTIVVDEIIVGSIAKYETEGEAEITYWIDSSYWGKGIAKSALKIFLTIEKTRPIFGRIAFDNIGSQKVLESCGFDKIGVDKGFAIARQAEIEEIIYQLK